ncbi:MAG: magnesium transporter [Corynebacterium sp.]|uniref:magnesium transporter n=1 Tax=Corynebacterium TaxID=1716 RepID=UPI0026483448|nr:magnesium transporter [Corynebacterium sp.]MDN5721915.1 magnesium transporter [Corynebacterium sp.]MDN6281740.1 magnesium transporter [Corynebacterium sp.]MDN6305627.1 magnesium transporter [Corynebacterium sp.]MDN6352265.1 magnesium transporter [Corynebacterium sp.]MDN6367530.1 magnesium transporter [Corynebacterium sp.]
MTTPQSDVIDLVDTIETFIENKNLPAISAAMTGVTPDELALVLERLADNDRAIVYRLLPKDRAMAVFDLFSPNMQGDLIHDLQDAEVAAIFAELDPDDRVWLLDELPATLAPRLLRGLSAKERDMTSEVLGYPKGSVGRRMSPESLNLRADATAGDTLERVRSGLDDAETVYALPVLDDARKVIGILSLRDVLRAEPDTLIGDIMQRPDVASAYQTAESAARKCTNLGHFALPVVDKEDRLVGVLTLDDAAQILEHEETEDTARQGGVEPLRRPYFATPVRSLVGSRVVWLLVLAIGATLTVQVMSTFEDTLEQVTVLALFVPLLIGTGGNAGNQAATTVTRALALGDVHPRDVMKVLLRELGVGVSLGALLGTLGAVITGLLFEPDVGIVIGLTLLAVCSMAATIGGVMPMIARVLKVDPAVFSNPFITTFVDATGLIVYFLIARVVLGI